MRKQWLLGARINYLKIKAEEQTEGGLIVPKHNINTTMELSVNDLLAGYEVYPGLRLTTGVRHVFSKVDVDISPANDQGLIPINRQLNLANEHMFDWLLGWQYRYWFDAKWGINAAFDAGIIGQNDRNLGFNLTGIHRFNQRHHLWIGYRYLQIGNDAEQNNIHYSVDFIQRGPQLGWGFSF